MNAPRPRAADGVVNALERDVISNRAVVDRHARMQVGAMEVDVAIIRQSDEAVPLADEQLDNPPPVGDAAGIRPRSTYDRRAVACDQEQVSLHGAVRLEVVDTNGRCADALLRAR